MAEYLGSWMRIPREQRVKWALSDVRKARWTLRWWYERFSEDPLGPRFAKILDDLNELEQLCLSATSTTAHAAEANADPAGTDASLIATTGLT